MSFDIKISGGRIVDGLGAPAVAGDVGIDGDTIVAVGDLGHADAATVIDAAGSLVCPGFVDAHSHSDTYLGNWIGALRYIAWVDAP